MKKFSSLGITAPILTALTDCGYEEPTVIQEKAIPAGLAGRDVLGCAQTGTGKTCAFGVPILQRLSKSRPKGNPRPIRALILTPTRELAIQIDENLKAYGKKLPLTECVIFGGVGQAPQVDQLKRGVDILTATPGRLLDLAGQKLLDLSQIEIFVLDEADRMLDMGFIHDVRKVLKLLPEKKQTLFFSATLPDEVMELVNSLLSDPVKVAAAPVSSPVEIIRQEICLVDRVNKTKLLLEILQAEEVKNALVFSRTKHGADKVARELTRAGVAAAAIHGNKSQTARQESLRKFKSGELPVLVATDIAARGLDIEALSYVFNYNLPEVPETYIHRIGRTGRAGREGTAISFCDFGEQPYLKDIEKLLKKSIPRREHDYPMEVFEAVKRDSRGRPINPDDAESREAARERNRQRKQAALTVAVVKQAEKNAPKPEAKEKKAEPVKAKKKAAKKAPVPVVKAEPIRMETKLPKPAYRPMPHGKQNLGNLQSYLDSMPDPDAEPIYTPHRNPLEGDAVLDATARLLAPKTAYRNAKTESKPKEKSRKAKTLPSEQKKKGAPVPPKKSGKEQERSLRDRDRGRGRIPPKPDTPKSRQKDSTEQASLMKPYYVNHD